MANIKSAIKRIKTTERNRARRREIKEKIKTAEKKAERAINKKEKDAGEKVKAVIKMIDTAVSAKILHYRTAARKKSRLMARYNKVAKK